MVNRRERHGNDGRGQGRRYTHIKTHEYQYLILCICIDKLVTLQKFSEQIRHVEMKAFSNSY